MAQQILNELFEKFVVLQKNKDLFTAHYLLKAASNIRDAIVTNDIITSACITNQELSEERKKILTNIKQFQDKVINVVSSKKCEIDNVGYASIKDFASAKKELLELINEETHLEIYSQNANLSILKNTQEVEKHVETLRSVDAHCTNNKYTVLIMGEFQSGKTTTLDALCGGRHIGAIGDGTATSAVPVSVSYSETDNIIINWKTKAQLQQLFSHLIQEFEDFDYDQFDLDDKSHRDIWLSKLETLRKSKACPNDIKYMALCSLVLKYYKTDQLSAQINRLATINNVHSITRFPVKFEYRWKTKGYADFNIEESLFIFINQVDCFCPSNILKKLNCTFIDSPGQFNSSYDTEVTENIMARVHAIMYLLPYHKGIGQDVCQSLYTILNNYRDVHRKLFIVNNISLKKDNLFVAGNCDEVKRMFGDQKSVTVYDAQLAYMGQAQHSYNNHLLSQEDIQYFSRPICRVNPVNGVQTKRVFESFENAFNYHIKSYLNICKWSDVPVPEITIKESGFNNLIDSLHRFIEENEAYSIIVSEGVDKLSIELTALRARLYALYIEPYVLGKGKIESLWKNRLEKANLFDRKMNRMTKKSLFDSEGYTESVCNRLTDAIYNKLFTEDFYEHLISEISYALYDNKGMITSYINLTGFDKDGYSRFISPIINKIISNQIGSKIMYWRTIVQSGQDQSFTDIFTPKMKEIELSLKMEWRELFADDKAFQIQNYVSIYTDIKDYYRNTSNGVDDEYGRFGSAYSQIAIPTALLAEIGVVTSSIAISLGGAIALAILLGIANPVGWVLFLIGGAALAIITIGRSKEWIRNKFKEYMTPDLKKMFREKDVYGSIKRIIEGEIKSILNLCEKTISLDTQKMETEREIATSSPEKVIENNCFEAIEVMDVINRQLKKYEDYKKKHVIYDEA